MKKLMVLILLIMVSFTIKAQKKFSILSSFEAGTQKLYMRNINEKLGYDSPQFLYANLEFGLRFYGLKAYGSSETLFGGFKSDRGFIPYFIDFNTTVSYEYKKVKLFYTHRCFHPIFTGWADGYTTTMDKIGLKIVISE